MTEDQIDAAFKSLADELSRLSHAQALAPTEHQRNPDENFDLAHLFRLTPSLCQHNLAGLSRLVMALLDLQDDESEELHPTH